MEPTRSVKTLAACAVTGCAALAALACAASAERLLLDQFFAASRLRDRTALARFATVIFEPGIDGVVDEFVVTATADVETVDARIGPERQQVIGLSLDAAVDPLDWTRYQLVQSERVVTVLAKIRTPGGAPIERRIMVTLQRASVHGELSRQGRSIVVRFAY